MEISKRTFCLVHDYLVTVRLLKTGHIAPAHESQYVKYVQSKLIGVGSGDSDPTFVSWGGLWLQLSYILFTLS